MLAYSPLKVDWLFDRMIVPMKRTAKKPSKSFKESLWDRPPKLRGSVEPWKMAPTSLASYLAKAPYCDRNNDQPQQNRSFCVT